MRIHVKDQGFKDDIIALNREAFSGIERAPDGIIGDHFMNGYVFAQYAERYLLGAALVMTDDQRFNEPYIWMIAVREKSRGMGVGKSLLDEVACFAREEGFSGVSLIVNNTNANAMRLYLKEGFVVKRFHPAYYGKDGDGVYMRRIV